MNKSLIFISFLLFGISCSDPEQQNDFSEVYESLSEQRQFYYNVEYSLDGSSYKSTSSLYGLVSLNRNSDSGVSSSYFGLTQKHLPNYLQSMYLKNEWIRDLSSNIFDLNAADILTDSLHSPILINPELLIGIQEKSNKITKHRLNEKDIKWTFNLEKEASELVLIWNEKLKKITELEYKYDVKSTNTYSRKWSFEYISKSDFNRLEMTYKHQNEVTHQPFL